LSPPEAPRFPRRGRVLIVDDDQTTTQALQQALELEQHDVLVALSAAEALDMIREDADFDVVFCNVSSHQTRGTALYGMLERELPNTLKRLIFLGDTSGAETPTAWLDGAPNQKLAKPLNLAEVSSLIARSIDSVDS